MFSKKIYLIKLILLSLLLSKVSLAKEYPHLDKLVKINANILNELSENNDLDENIRIKIDSYFSLNFNENWSTKTSWKINPVPKRKSVVNPYKYRSFFSDKKNYSESDFFIEQLKAEYSSDELKISFGKINPKYGKLWNKENKIGSIALDIIRDYELKEKIGYEVVFLDKNFSIYVANFFNDNTDLSNGAFKNRGKEGSFIIKRAGNTSTLSSYSVNIEGNITELSNNLTYNLAYSNLDNSSKLRQKNQKSFLISLQKNILSTPFKVIGEIVIINNPLGTEGKRATYFTSSINYTNNNWNLFASSVIRKINHNKEKKINDRVKSYGVNYLINNKYNIELSRIELKEDGNKADILQLGLSMIF
jgi:hypothetical protein